jgi:AraC family transcriptional regulator
MAKTLGGIDGYPNGQWAPREVLGSVPSGLGMRRFLQDLERPFTTFTEVEVESPMARPTLQVRIQESVLHYFDSLGARPDGDCTVSVPRNISSIVDRLSKVLRTAGIDIRKLDHSPENAMRLAIVASLVETLAPSLPATSPPRAVRALSKWRLIRVLSYINANIGEPLTLANLAATAGLSRMHFARQFRAATGISPHEYVLRTRIERAQKLLAATSDALVDIGLNVGFKTQTHFTTVFKRIVGNTPRRWRREQPTVS